MDAQAPHSGDWRQGVDARLLRQLWRRARQPGLIPMGLARRIHARVHALRERVQGLAWLSQRYAMGGGSGTERVPIVHALGPSWPGQVTPPPPATPTTPVGRPVGEPPVRLVVKAVTLVSREGSVPPPPPREAPPVHAPLPRVVPLRAPSSAPHDPSPPQASRLPWSPVPPVRALSAGTGETPSGEPRSALPPVLLLPLRGKAAPGGAATEGPPPAPPPSGPSPAPLFSVRPLAPPGAAPAEGALAEASPALPRVQPLPQVEGPPPVAGRIGTPSPGLPRVAPRRPSGAAQRSGEAPPLLHPLGAPPPAGGSPPVQEVHFPAAPRQPGAAPPAPAPPAPGPRQDSAPVSQPPLDLETLTSKVRQRLLRQLAEEKVRRGVLR